MIQSLSHIQRSRRLSQDFDDYLERTSRSSIHSSSSDIISPHYDYAHQHEAKLLAYQQNQHTQIQFVPPVKTNYEDMMHNAHSGPNQPAVQTNEYKNIFQYPPNKLIGNLNATKQIDLNQEQLD
eukprot:931936_1